MSEDKPMIAAGASPGPSVDRTGAPVVDPTKNVLDLVHYSFDRLISEMISTVRR